jgi:hypothetical protein
MQNTKLFRALAGFLTIALLAVSSSGVHAAANEFTGTVSLDNSAVSASAVQTIAFTPNPELSDGDTVVLTYPDSSFVFGSLSAADVSVVQTSGTFGAETINSTTRTISIPVTTAGTGAVTVTVGATNKMTNPSVPGQYSIHIAAKTGEIVDQTGYALASVGNNVSVTATVAEALILTIAPTSVNINVDPSVNSGEDFSQKTVLTAKTNAASGYKIQAKLSGAEVAGSAQLDGTDTGNTSSIAAGNSRTTENKIGYIAYNADETKTQAQLESDATNAQTFAAGTAANLTLYDGTTDGVKYDSPTNEQDHTVYYALNVDYLTPAGTYAGTVTYVALPTF